LDLLPLVNDPFKGADPGDWPGDLAIQQFPMGMAIWSCAAICLAQSGGCGGCDDRYYVAHCWRNEGLMFVRTSGGVIVNLNHSIMLALSHGPHGSVVTASYVPGGPQDAFVFLIGDNHARQAEAVLGAIWDALAAGLPTVDLMDRFQLARPTADVLEACGCVTQQVEERLLGASGELKRESGVCQVPGPGGRPWTWRQVNLGQGKKNSLSLKLLLKQIEIE
jgi:hypothetical protein